MEILAITPRKPSKRMAAMLSAGILSERKEIEIVGVCSDGCYVCDFGEEQYFCKYLQNYERWVIDDTTGERPPDDWEEESYQERLEGF